MRLGWAVILAALLALAGCGGPAPAPEAPSSPVSANAAGQDKPDQKEAKPSEDTLPSDAQEPKDAAGKLREQMRSGSVQIDGVLSTLADAKDALDKQIPGLKAEVKDGADEAAASLDAAGASLAELTGESPTVEEIRKDLAKAEKIRKASADNAAEALIDLRSAANILTGLAEDNAKLKEAAGLAATAVAELEDAIKALGGTVPEE